MIVVRLKPRDFTIPLQHLHDLAAEHFGSMLHETSSSPDGDKPWAAQPAGDGNAEVWEFGFEDAHGVKARDLAVAFAQCLGCFKRPSGGPASGEPIIGDS